VTSGRSGPEDRILAARAELDQVIARVQEDLYRFQRQNEPTREELQALQDAALRGELGEDMRELARHVDSGRDTWASIFSGNSPHSDLLRAHLDRMVAENREAITTAIAQDPTFDPFPPDQPH
jgi:hypothetical protein